ncbi:MAG: pilus assembly protein PilP [Desulfosalsimonadaceae bacterium]
MQKLFIPLICIGCLLFLAPAVDEVYAESSRTGSSPGGASQRVKIVQPEEQQPEEQSRADEVKKSETPDAEESEEEAAPQQDSSSASSGDAEDAEKMQEDVAALMGEKQQYYVSKGRPDPFEPFISGEERSQEKGGGDKPGSERKPRGPLEKISLSQLQLTAVMKTPGQNLALVEEASGKGYVVEKGTYIGDQGGQITQILPDAIVVEEKYRDAFGDAGVRKKKLKLQK